MFYKNVCRITSLEDMNEGVAQKLYIETGSFVNIYIKCYKTLFVGIKDI